MLKNLLFLVEFNRIKPSGVIDYLDENGKIVMFKGNENDKMVGTKAANFDFDGDVDVKYSLKGFDVAPDALLTKLFELNHFKEHISRGITYVGGAGSDRITGTDYDDILYGHDKEGKDDDEATDTLVGGKGSDKLYGGKGDDILVGHTGSMIDDDIRDELYGGDGFDTYYAGDKDVIFDSDGKGKVVFEGVELKGGTYDKGKGVYVSNDRSVEYKLSGDKLAVSKGGKFLTINSFTNSQKDPHLGIYLLKNDDKPSPNKNPEEQGDLPGDQGGLFPASNPVLGARYIVDIIWPDYSVYTRDYLPWERIETDDLPIGARIKIITSMPGGSFHTGDYDVTEQTKAAWRNKNSAPAKTNDANLEKNRDDALSGKNTSNASDSAPGDSTSTAGTNAGNDKIYAGKSDDVITGGAGDDTIYGEEGADTFKFNPGDGNDTLYTDSSDKLILNAVKAQDVKFKYENNHLRVSYSQNDSALLINYALNQSNQIKGIELDDGSYITSKKINETMQKISEYLKENQAGENDPQIKNIMMSGWSQGGDDGWSL